MSLESRTISPPANYQYHRHHAQTTYHARSPVVPHTSLTLMMTTKRSLLEPLATFSRALGVSGPRVQVASLNTSKLPVLSACDVPVYYCPVRDRTYLHDVSTTRLVVFPLPVVVSFRRITLAHSGRVIFWGHPAFRRPPAEDDDDASVAV
ncbi:hypothetical protein OG21DRAFT_1323875 [Imleria badia]|nr:hypothetical protein OG21DRAFT_1323875 [Imleria badia]